MPLQLYPELSLGSAWRQVDRRSLKALIDRKTDRIERPIEPFLVSIAEGSNLVAVAAQSRTAEPHWKWAGQVFQFANTGIPNHPIAYCDRAVAIPLKAARAARLEPFGAGGVEIRVNKWIRDCQVWVWAYTGQDSTVQGYQTFDIEVAAEFA